MIKDLFIFSFNPFNGCLRWMGFDGFQGILVLMEMRLYSFRLSFLTALRG